MTDNDLDSPVPFVDENAVDVVLLRAAGGRTIPIDGTDVVDLTDTSELSSEVTTELLGSALRLTAAIDMPGEVVELVRQAPVPPAFQGSPWLRHHRALIFRDGRSELRDFVFIYDQDIGVVIHRNDAE